MQKVIPVARRGVVGGGQDVLPSVGNSGNFRKFEKTLYQLRMCVMMSWNLNVNVRQKNIKLCPPLSPYPRRPWLCVKLKRIWFVTMGLQHRYHFHSNTKEIYYQTVNDDFQVAANYPSKRIIIFIQSVLCKSFYHANKLQRKRKYIAHIYYEIGSML